LYPERVDVLAVQDRLTLCWAADVPVPVTEAADGALAALLENEMLPEVAPLAWGANVSVNVALRPAAMVAGSDNPLSANSPLLEVAEETVTLAPLAVSVPV